MTKVDQQERHYHSENGIANMKQTHYFNSKTWQYLTLDEIAEMDKREYTVEMLEAILEELMKE